MKKLTPFSLILFILWMSGFFAVMPSSTIQAVFDGQNNPGDAPYINPSPRRTADPSSNVTSRTEPPGPPYSTPTVVLESAAVKTPFYQAQIIGYSVEGNAMWVYQFGDGPSAVMMVAGVHGGYEWNTVALMDQIIARLKRYPDLIPADNTLYILRVFNVDGYVRDKGDDGRLNSNGVDLNRNWKANWKDSWEGTECWSRRVVSAGTGPFSEPESQALRDFILAHDIQALINYHSAALGIFAGGPDDLESIRFAQTLAEVSNYRFPPYETDCEFTGQFVDWASRQGIDAVDLELTTHSRTDFAVNLIVLQELLKWGKAD